MRISCDINGVVKTDKIKKTNLPENGERDQGQEDINNQFGSGETDIYLVRHKQFAILL
jgi:hypothetical protein